MNLILNYIMKFIKYLIQLIYNFFIFKKENKVEIINYNTYLIKDFDIKLFQEINNYRKLNNIPFLDLGSSEIFNIAGDHINWLYNNVKDKEEFSIKGHYFNYDRFQQVKLRDKNIQHVGENLAYGYINPKSIIKAWENSEGHKEILLNKNFNKVVIASKNKIVIAIFYK